MRFQLPRIYPITDTCLSGLSHAGQVEELIVGGARLIQLREKLLSPREFYEAALEVVDIARRHGIQIIVNDRVDIALATKADGVHLGQDDMPPEKARSILGDNAIIGLSTHSIDDVVAATGLGVDYIAFGPIFATGTKTDHEAPVGIEGLRQASRAVHGLPLVAIGGITASNVGEIFEAGADAAAMIGAILAPPGAIALNMQRLSELAENA